MKYILFLGSPYDKNKNYQLAQEAVRLLERSDVELINVYNRRPRGSNTIPELRRCFCMLFIC